MTTTAIRQRLYEYIRFADDKKVKAIYAALEKEVNAPHHTWTKDFMKLLDKRFKEIESGEVEGAKLESVLRKAQLLAKKK